MRNLPIIWFGKIRSFVKRHRVRLREEHTAEYFTERFHKPLMVLLGVILWLGTAFALTFKTTEVPPIHYLEDGVTAATTIIAYHSFAYDDQTATEFARDKVAESAPVVLLIAQGKNAQIKSQIVSLFTALRSNSETREAFFTRRGINPVAGNNLAECINLKSFESGFFDKLSIILGRGVLDTAILTENYPPTREVILALGENRRTAPRLFGTLTSAAQAAEQIAAVTLRPADLQLNPGTEELFADLLSEIFASTQGNLVVDTAEIAAAVKELRAKVEPVSVSVERGTPIVVTGHQVTQKNKDMLNAYRQELSRENRLSFTPLNIAKMLLASLLLIAVSLAYIASTSPELLKSARKMWIIGITILICLAINCLVVRYADSLAAKLNFQVQAVDIFPLALAPALLSVIVSVRAGIFGGVFVAFVTAGQQSEDFGIVAEGIILSLVVCYAVHGAINYRQYFTRTLFSVLITVAVLKSLTMLAMGTFGDQWALVVFHAFYNGMATAVMALLLLFLLDGVLGVTTDITLFSLADANHPLLKRLQMEAPGTYFHSQAVASIAEQGALDIKASPIRARVAGLFHDIGKLSNPEYFTENISGLDSPHRMIKPSVSAIVIQSHVKEGVERAIKYHLPRFVRDAIRQHHGTSKVGYFYQLALESGTKEELDEQIFRYQGPLPSEKEIVIVALADACEAAARSIEKPTPAKIENLVSDIFRHRLKEKQLNEAQLTFQEFATLGQSFVKSLSTMYHSRISYPKDEPLSDADTDDDLFTNQPTHFSND